MTRAAKVQKRCKRKRDSERARAEKQNRRLQLLRGLIDDLGLSEFEKPMNLRNRLCEICCPGIRISNSVGGKWHDRADGLREELLLLLNDENRRLEGTTFTPSEFISVIMPAIDRLGNLAVHCQPSISARLARRARQKVDVLTESIESYLTWLFGEIRDLILLYSDIEEMQFSLEQATDDGPSAMQPTSWEIRCHNTSHVQHFIDGERRVGFRCHLLNEGAVFNGEPGLRPVEWNLEELGVSADQRIVPVYVQPHVIERLYGATGRLRSLFHQKHLLNHILCKALHEPVIRQYRDEPNTFLVDYGPKGCKLGYLVCQVLSDAVIARTFLFITMDGTPESNVMYRNWRVNRFDKKFLGFDSMNEIATSDIRNDPILIKLFQDCNLGHLLEAITYNGIPESGSAARCRQYLGIKDDIKTLSSIE